MFRGWPSWVVSFWRFKVRHMPVAAVAAAVQCRSFFVLPMHSFACRCSLMALPCWKMAMDISANQWIKKHTDKVHAAEGSNRMSKYFLVLILMGSILGASLMMVACDESLSHTSESNSIVVLFNCPWYLGTIIAGRIQCGRLLVCEDSLAMPQIWQI